jgi:hypothetical protein
MGSLLITVTQHCSSQEKSLVLETGKKGDYLRSNRHLNDITIAIDMQKTEMIAHGRRPRNFQYPPEASGAYNPRLSPHKCQLSARTSV